MKGYFLRSVLMLMFFHLSVIKAQTGVKANVVFVPIGAINIAAEQAVAKKWTVQEELFISPWKSFAGKHLQIYMATLEGRYYFKEAMKKFYVGAYVSAGHFNLQKWNYWHPGVVVDAQNEPQYLEDGSLRITEVYQKGYSFVFGISGGYHFTLSDTVGLEIFAGIGTSQGLYKGYFKDNNQRADKAHGWNKSGELIPTRGGLMLTYKL